MLRVFLVHMSSRLSLDFFVLNLVARPLFDEEIWVRDFVMLGLGFYRFNPVMSNLSYRFFFHVLQFSSVQFLSQLLYSCSVACISQLQDLHVNCNNANLTSEPRAR